MADIRERQAAAPQLGTRSERAPALADREDERHEEPFTEIITAVLGSASRNGEWEPADCTRVFALCGNAELDFTRALLVPGVTEVEVYTACGSAKVIVPEGLEVELTGNALLGDFKQSARVSKARRLLRRTWRAALGEPPDDDPDDLEPDEDPPLLRVSGFAFLGSVKVVTR